MDRVAEDDQDVDDDGDWKCSFVSLNTTIRDLGTEIDKWLRSHERWVVVRRPNMSQWRWVSSQKSST